MPGSFVIETVSDMSAAAHGKQFHSPGDQLHSITKLEMKTTRKALPHRLAEWAPAKTHGQAARQGKAELMQGEAGQNRSSTDPARLGKRAATSQIHAPCHEASVRLGDGEPTALLERLQALGRRGSTLIPTHGGILTSPDSTGTSTCGDIIVCVLFSGLEANNMSRHVFLQGSSPPTPSLDEAAHRGRAVGWHCLGPACSQRTGSG